MTGRSDAQGARTPTTTTPITATTAPTKMYLIVFVALAFFTLASFFAN